MEGTIEDVLKQLKLRSMLEKPKFTHNILPLFQFPRLKATLTTLQHYSLYNEEPVADGRRVCGVVESSFISEFFDAVGVQTDFNAQVSFLPELLKSYAHGSSKVRAYIAQQPAPICD